uniref:aminopeptidase N-like n=1 Tax=Doryrhamphus excisus TaxID=161450 RepID=UPI0025AE7E8F|nr:aminopeptidase N-like [Doryrhamphus excisus]
MAKTSTSKGFAAAFVILTVSVIGSIVTMIVLYKTEIATMNPTPRPTFPSTTEGPPPVMRLPSSLVPHHYKIFLQTHFYHQITEEVNVTTPNQTMLFTGNSSVDFRCVERTRSIYLHSRDLMLGQTVVKNEDTGQKIIISHVKHHADESDFLEIGLTEAMQEGSNYSLFVTFQGQMSQSLQGLYVSTYARPKPTILNEMNVLLCRFLASTNLQPTGARRVFPCFDEPHLKAVFDVNIIHRKSTTALGNAEESGSDILDRDWQLTRFHPTPKMSTYLLAFTVSDLTSARSPHQRVRIQTYARPDATEAGHTGYAANVTASILDFYEKHLQINYLQKKLDQVALPDLSASATEPWGLITYAEDVLLYQTGVSSLLHKETISYLIAHQLAHQWFGNLVTMSWWSEVWLKEGFATYAAALALDHLQPALQARERKMMTALHVAMDQDALASSRPLTVPPEEVQSTSQILDLFDAFTSYKGASLLAMLADAVEPRVFNKGIQMYLRAFMFDNAQQSDLWDYIQKAVDEEGGHTKVAALMATWTNQIGYPVITINTTNGELYQKHFLFNTSFPSTLWWYVPIRVMSEASEASLVWLESSDTVRKEEFISEDRKWILANVGCSGYYRVNYDPENWDRLLMQLESNPHGIPEMNRGQLIDDAFHLARANLVHVSLALNTTHFLGTEDAFIPWQSAVRNLEYFVHMFDRSEVYGPMQAYLRDQVQNLYGSFRNLTEESDVPEDHLSQHLQITAIDVACSNGLPECVRMATTMFADWMSSSSNQSNKIHPNLRSIIYCQAVAAGGEEEWEFAWDKFQTSNESSEKEQLRQAMSCTRKVWLLSRYLEYTLDPEKIRLMDVTSTIDFIARNVVGHGLAWNFMRAHWDYVSQGGGAKLIDSVTRRFSTPFELEQLETFAPKCDARPCAGAVERAVERTKVNIQWVTDNKETVLDWFESRRA